MLTEKQLVEKLENWLKDQLEFQTYIELQITNKNLDISQILDNDQQQVRIDLCGISQIDSTIHFFEAETQLHILHPTIYRQFCDYCYLICPDEQFSILDTETQEQQLNWAKDEGIGIVSITEQGVKKVRTRARRQDLTSDVRKEVLRCMNQRTKIDFSTTPLWLRNSEP